MMEKKLSRRDFLAKSAALGAAAAVAPSIITSCAKSNKPLREPGEYYIPGLEDKADNGRELKVGLVGCGNRGTGALLNLLDAADGITVAALGDAFPDKMEESRKKIFDKKGITVPDEMCFVGLDAFKKVMDSAIDMVIITPPPIFHAEMFEYAVSKGLHIFVEKPVSIDAKGYRRVVAASRQADLKGLVVVTGTQRHHKRDYVEAYKKVQEGMIGEITGGTVYWNTKDHWYKKRQPGWTDMEYMIRDWINWCWVSGDNIVEQHVHNIDVFMWFIGSHPISARAIGSRQRRSDGDQFDQFSTDFEFENGVHLHSMCQQINGCDRLVKEVIHGTKGWWDSDTKEIRANDGTLLWKFDPDKEKAEHSQVNPYVLEHVDWVNHIRRGTAHNETIGTAESCLAGSMGRESAYTGKLLTWDEFSASDNNLRPDGEFTFRNMDMSKYQVPKPGTE